MGYLFLWTRIAHSESLLAWPQPSLIIRLPFLPPHLLKWPHGNELLAHPSMLPTPLENTQNNDSSGRHFTRFTLRALFRKHPGESLWFVWSFPCLPLTTDEPCWLVWPLSLPHSFLNTHCYDLYLIIVYINCIIYLILKLWIDECT